MRPKLFRSQACCTKFILAAYNWRSASSRIDDSACRAASASFRETSALDHARSASRLDCVTTTACQALIALPKVRANTTAVVAVNATLCRCEAFLNRYIALGGRAT